MQRYSALSAALAKALNSFPILKALAKNTYYHFCSILYHRSYQYKLHPPVKSIKIAEFGNHISTFWGYYDQSPWSPSQNKIAFLSVDHPSNSLPSPDIPVSIIVSDTELNNPRTIAQSRAWNWQQGVRLCWLSDNIIIFNDFDSSNDRYCSRIVDIVTRTESLIQFPINGVFKDTFALALNYDRLAKLRPDYGYRNRPHAQKKLKPISDDDGVFFIDLQTVQCKLIISLEQLANLKPRPEMNNAWHKVNHIMISPKGNHFIFLHRWYVGRNKFTRLILSDIQGKNLKVLLDEKMVSHFWWYNEKIILSWARYNGKDNYYLINTEEGIVKPLGEYTLLGDGHPSVSCKGIIITDTYPDKGRMRHLLSLNNDDSSIIEIAEFHEPLKFSGENRVDLHPCFSPDGGFIAVDTIYSGNRRLAIIELVSIV